MERLTIFPPLSGVSAPSSPAEAGSNSGLPMLGLPVGKFLKEVLPDRNTRTGLEAWPNETDVARRSVVHSAKNRQEDRNFFFSIPTPLIYFYLVPGKRIEIGPTDTNWRYLVSQGNTAIPFKFERFSSSSTCR
jgi:hypothetical protein